MKKYFQLFIIISSCVLNAQTEKKVDNQNLLWTRYYNQVDFNAKWSIHSEIENRIFINPMVENLVVARIQGRYKFSDQIVMGSGIAYFYVSTQDPKIDLDFNEPEYRIQQDITLKQNFGKIFLNHRYQIEERFFHNFNSQGLKSGTTFAMRFRYRIQGEYDFWKEDKQYLRTIVYDEIMINGGDKIVKNKFDQNRIYAGLQYGINSKLAIELGYMNSFQQRATGVDYFNRNIIRLSVYHKLKI